MNENDRPLGIEQLKYEIPQYIFKSSRSASIGSAVKKVSQLGLWYIGITNRLDERQDEHDDPPPKGYGATPDWHRWVADSESTARKIESRFQDVFRMHGAPGGNINDAIPVYVYVFYVGYFKPVDE